MNENVLGHCRGDACVASTTLPNAIFRVVEMKRQHYIARFAVLIVTVLALATLTAACGDQKLEDSIVGKWKVANSAESWEFSKDGKLSVSGGQTPAAGVYKISDESHIYVEIQGPQGLSRPEVLEVRISSDRMTLYARSVLNLELTKEK